MAANGGGPPFIKKEEELDSNCKNSNKTNNRGISIAERRAAKCGFNASVMNAARFNPAALSPPLRPPYFTVPPGISPSALLDSPIMLPNAQAQLSPTTGTFQFPSPNHESLKLKLKLSSGNGVPMESCEANNFINLAENKPCQRNLQEMKQKAVECFDSSNIANNANNNTSRNQMMSGNKGERSSLHIPNQKNGGGGGGGSSANNHNNNNPKNSEDGFYWRKYGQKHVKGSEYPRSYYKCTNTNCPVTKKVERSHDGHITEIVYKNSHNHPNPKREMGGGGSSSSRDQLLITSDHNLTMDNGTSTSNFLTDLPPDPINNLEFVPAYGGQEVDNVASPESVSFNEEDADENGESSEAKKRKRESSSFPSESSTAVARSTREPKVVVQIQSEIDILDDGYRWRKYGQKVVKGNPNPRSYYKCTTPGCPVRKHVERAANDIKSVITTYEGKHNHQVPSGKTIHNSDVHPPPPAPHTTTATLATSSTIKPSDTLKSHGKQVHVPDLPLYLDRKPILDYNDLLRSSTLPGAADLNFRPSSLYPLPLPPFHSFPYGSVSMNVKTFPSSSKLYPMMPDYMAMPSSSSSPQLNHHHAAVSSSGMPPLAGTYHYTTTTTAFAAAHHQLQPESSRAVIPKEEQIRDEDELYDTCLSMPNQHNGTI